MQKILADVSVSISTFKDNPAKSVRESEGSTLCVLSNNKPAFYVIDPDAWERINDLLDDIAIAPAIEKALKRKGKAIRVALEDL